MLCVSYRILRERGRWEKPEEDPTLTAQRFTAKTPKDFAAIALSGHRGSAEVTGFPEELRAQAPRTGSGEGKASLHFHPGYPKGSWGRAPGSPPPSVRRQKRSSAKWAGGLPSGEGLVLLHRMEPGG